MKHYCNYHPLSPAIWHCEACEIYFDKLCLPDGDDKLQQANCPHCSGALRYLDKKAATTPFWNHKKRFAKLILQPEPILAVCVIALLSIASMLHVVVAIIASAGLCLLATNCAIVMSKNIEKKEASSPTLNDLFSITELRERCILTAILVFVFGGPIAIAYLSNIVLAVLISIPLLFVIPSVLLAGLYEPPQRSKQQLSRPSWVDIMRQLKGSYFTLVGFFTISYLVVLVVIDVAQQTVPMMLTIPVSTALSCFLLCFNFACLGYVLRRYEGFNAVANISKSAMKQSIKQEAKSTSNSAERFEADLDIAVKTGDYDKALVLLESSLQKKARSDLRRQQLYKLLNERNDINKLAQHAESLLELLLGRGQNLLAYELIAKVHAHTPEFQLYDLDTISKLIDIFIEMKEYELVSWMAGSTKKHFDPSPELANVYLKAAKIHLSKLGQVKLAFGYLEWIVKYFPESENANAAQRLIDHIKARSKSKKDA